MKKWKLALIIVVFTAIVAGGTFGVNAAYNGVTQNTNKFNDVPNGIEVCNFGSSHGLYGYNYEEYEDDLTCFNFALDSQTLSYDLRVLETYRSHIKKGAVVFLTVSYFSFTEKETEYESFASKNLRYYEFLPANKIKEYDFYTDLMSYRLKSLSIGPENVVKAFIRHEKTVSKWQEDYEKTKKRDCFSMDRKANAEAAAKRHIVTYRRDEHNKLVNNDEEIDALYRMIEIIKEIGATPYLVTTPYLPEYTDEIVAADPNFYPTYYALVRRIARETGTEYLDYAREPYFAGRYDLFINPDHLNERGAAVFTSMLYDDVLKEHFGLE